MVRQPGATGDDGRLFRVLTIAERPDIVSCRGGLLVQAHHTFANHPPLDLLIVPGGAGTRRERENPRLLQWIADQEPHTKITASVCTGSFLLAANNLPKPSYPSTYAAVLSVAAHDVPEPERIYYNPAPPVEFGAHGIDVHVAWQAASTITATGNSFATPMSPAWSPACSPNTPA